MGRNEPFQAMARAGSPGWPHSALSEAPPIHHFNALSEHVPSIISRTSRVASNFLHFASFQMDWGSRRVRPIALRGDWS
jgi:hypothetical protein